MYTNSYTTLLAAQIEGICLCRVSLSFFSHTGWSTCDSCNL